MGENLPLIFNNLLKHKMPDFSQMQYAQVCPDLTPGNKHTATSGSEGGQSTN